jgi:hypothetical protein
MMKSPVLIGSQFFGRTHARSDADYCFEDTPEMHRFLSDIGFNAARFLYEGEQQEQSYWQLRSRHVDVFLVRSVSRRRLARNLLRWTGLFRMVRSKKNRQRIWWALGTCIERIWAVYSQERLLPEEKPSKHWTTPFRDD